MDNQGELFDINLSMLSLLHGARRPANDIEAKWLAFHGDNPHVYRLFKRFASQAINAGHAKLSSFMILNRIRWETMTGTEGAGVTDARSWSPDRGEPLKINNNHAPYYARLWLEEHPGYEGFFATRTTLREVA